jgi:hypothetical protein
MSLLLTHEACRYMGISHETGGLVSCIAPGICRSRVNAVLHN